MLHDMLFRLAREFVYERARPFAGSAFGDFVRHDIAREAKRQLLYLPYELNVKSSVGTGNWAAVPWLGFFDPLITESATRGFYVVYLINPQTEAVYLSMNQGTTAVYQEFGERRGREVLRRRAVDIADRVPDYAELFSRDRIDLGSNEALPAGYTAGHSFGRAYIEKAFDETAFYKDLETMLSGYETLIDRGGTTPLDVMQEDAGGSDVAETRRYTLSRRIERAPKVRERVLSVRQAVCESCGLDPAIHFGYEGPLKKTPLDIHHSRPVGGLAEGETRRYQIPDDFRVLCPTCHRMIHKQDDPSDLQALKAKVAFKYQLKRNDT